MLPAHFAAQHHRRVCAHHPLGVSTQAQRRYRRVGTLLVALQRRCAAIFRDAVIFEIDVRQIGERSAPSGRARQQSCLNRP